MYLKNAIFAFVGLWNQKYIVLNGYSSTNKIVANKIKKELDVDLIDDKVIMRQLK
jgi:hypothetical protein